MKKLFIIGSLILCIILGSCSSGKNVSYKFKNQYKKYEDENNSEIISGAISFQNWFNEVNWSTINENSGHTDLLLAKSVGSIFNSGNYFMLVFAGAWCSDCRSQLPIIKRVIDSGKIDDKKIQLLGADKDNVVWKHENLAIKADKYPTVVILLNSKEIGRIEEFPKESWEKDILQILYRNNEVTEDKK